MFLVIPETHRMTRCEGCCLTELFLILHTGADLKPDMSRERRFWQEGSQAHQKTGLTHPKIEASLSTGFTGLKIL